MLSLLLLASAVASPDMPEQVPTVDLSGHTGTLLVLDDRAGNIVVVDPKSSDEWAFFGDRTRVWRLSTLGYSAEGDTAFDVWARDFRAKDRATTLNFRDGKYTMACDGNSRELFLLPPDETKKVLASVTAHEQRWRRNAVAFYRDEFGVYYFIDRATGDDLDADHRVYMGWKGQMLRSPMTLVASDSLGRVYSAANGARRLVLTRDQARYVEGTVERVLLPLDLVGDGPLAYTTLGVYGDAPHGTPCDVLRKK